MTGGGCGYRRIDSRGGGGVGWGGAGGGGGGGGVFLLMIRRPPRSTLDRSSAASDVYKRQGDGSNRQVLSQHKQMPPSTRVICVPSARNAFPSRVRSRNARGHSEPVVTVSYTHLRAHETVLELVCRLLLENKQNHNYVLCLYDSYFTYL